MTEQVETKLDMYRNPLYKGFARNAHCVCMSGKKVKHCHGKNYSVDAVEFKIINQMITMRKLATEATND